MRIQLHDIEDQTVQTIEADDDLSGLLKCERSIVESCREMGESISMGMMVAEPMK